MIKDIFFSNKLSEKIPIWCMRQAGRYLPEYNEIRAKHPDFINFCQQKEQVCEVTLQPIRRFDFDAAIIFSDILVILDALGYKVSFAKNHGPIVDNFSYQDIKPISEKAFFDSLANIYEAITLTRSKLAKEKDLIGFAGAPWTLACYLIEGKGSKDFSKARQFAYQEPQLFERIIDNLTDYIILHLENQIRAGCDIIQIFDSWSGLLAEGEFNKWVIAPTRKIVSSLKANFPKVPIIGFPKGAGVMYKDYAEISKVDAVSLDYSASSHRVWENMDIVLQGNLDPCVLLAHKDRIKAELEKNIIKFEGKRYIFNLGHGILPNTPIENVEYIVSLIRQWKR